MPLRYQYLSVTDPVFPRGTRFYLPSTTVTPPISPGFNAGWDETSDADRRSMFTTKQSTAFTDKSITTALSVGQTLFRQYISIPLAAQILSSPVYIYVRAMETLGTLNAVSQIVLKVVSADGSVVRGTLLDLGDFGGGTEFNTSLRNKSFADGDVPTSVTTLDGDYLVLEIGISHAAVIDVSAINFGDTSDTDLPEDETTTSADNPFLVLGQTVLFQDPIFTFYPQQNEPVLEAPISHSALYAPHFFPFTLEDLPAESITLDRWYQPWSEPVLPLTAPEGLFLTDPARLLDAEFPSLDKWNPEFPSVVFHPQPLVPEGLFLPDPARLLDAEYPFVGWRATYPDIVFHPIPLTPEGLFLPDYARLLDEEFTFVTWLAIYPDWIEHSHVVREGGEVSDLIPRAEFVSVDKYWLNNDNPVLALIYREGMEAKSLIFPLPDLDWLILFPDQTYDHTQWRRYWEAMEAAWEISTGDNIPGRGGDIRPSLRYIESRMRRVIPAIRASSPSARSSRPHIRRVQP